MNKLITIILLLFCLQSYGQLKLTGQVLDLKNNPLANASINIVGVNASGITDETGVFFMALPTAIKKGDIITLRVSRDGYNTINKHVAVTYLSIPIKLIKDNHTRNITNHTDANSSSTGSQPSIPPSITTQIQTQPTNITSNFQSGGITAAQVNIGAVPRKLGSDLSTPLLNYLTRKDEKIIITCLLGDAESFQFATIINTFLKAQGYTKVDGVNQAVFNIPVIGQSLSRDSTGVKIVIGSRQ